MRASRVTALLGAVLLGLFGCAQPAPPSKADSASHPAAPATTPAAFSAPASQPGRLILSAGALRFLACGEQGEGTPIDDLPKGEGAALIRELGGGAERGITVMARLEQGRLLEIRYAGLEGPPCDRLPPDGDLEARGNEPFWSLTVDGSEALLRTPEEPEGVAYSEGRWSHPEGTTRRYEARREEESGASETLKLEITEERCMDSMSGARYPFRAVLTRGTVLMKGCAIEGRGSHRGDD
jgi:uncharacterized membrane protein